MLYNKTKAMLLFRIITIALVCAFTLSGIPCYAIADTTSDFALAPPLATKPPCEIIQRSDGTWDVVTNGDVIRSWDKETTRSAQQGDTLGKAFRNRWAFVDVGYLIAQMLILAREHKLHNPKNILIPLIKKHIRNRDGEAEILLEGYNIDGIEEVRKNGKIIGFSLPVIRNGMPAYKLVYNLQGGDTYIQMKDGTNVWMEVEPIEKVELHIDKSAWDVLPSSVSDRIKKAVSWEKMEYDSISGNRSIIINLPEPVTIGGKVINAIKVKGIIYKDRETGEISRPIMKDFTGFGRTRIKVDFTAEGIPITNPTENRPIGTMLLNRAEQEYNMVRALFDDGFSTDYPLGFGELLDKKFEGRRVGFVMLGIEDASDARVNDLPMKDTPHAFMVVGRTIRKLNKKGYIHTFPHVNNFSVSRDSEEANIHDLDQMKRTSTLPSLTAEYWYRIYEFFNLVYSIERFYMKEQFSDEFRKELIHNFFAGYFEDEKIDPTLSRKLYNQILEIRRKIIGQYLEREIIDRPDWFKGEILDLIKIATDKDRNGIISIQSEGVIASSEAGTISSIQPPVHDKRNPLLYNSWIENLLARRESHAERDRECCETFLKRNHPLKEEIFSHVDSLPDDEILTKLNACMVPAMEEDTWLWNHTYSIPLGRNLTFKELFLHLTAGDKDVSQIFLTRILFYAEPENIEENLSKGREGKIRRNIEFNYLILKAMEILSKRSGLVLIEAETLDALTEYLTQSRVSWSAEELLSLADLILPADTPQKQESLKNLLALIDRLKEQDPQLKQDLSKSGPQARIREMEDALKSTAAAVDASPESEGIHAASFQDTISYIQAQPQAQPLIVALGTSWIKGYEKGRYLQYDALNPLISSIRTYCESKDIPFIVDDDDKLLARINAERAREGKTGAKVVVLAGENTVKSDEFAPLRSDEKNAFVVGVNNQELTIDSYIRLMEMLTLALKLSAGMEVTLDNIYITITKDNERNIYIFLPHAEPMDYERLKVIYEVQKFA